MYAINLFPDDELEPIIDRLSQAHAKSGLTYSAIARSLGYNHETISFILNGHQHLTVKWLLRFAKAYNVSPAWLLTGEGHE